MPATAPHLRPAVQGLAAAPVKEQPVEEEVYLGDMPIMIGGGEFIINGGERHRSSASSTVRRAIDYVIESEGADRKLHSCRIIPERAGWDRGQCHEEGHARRAILDQSGKFSAMTLLQHGRPNIRPTRRSSARSSKPRNTRRPRRTAPALEGNYTVGDIIDPETGEGLSQSGVLITKEHLDKIYASDVKAISVLPVQGRSTKRVDTLILNSLKEER